MVREATSKGRVFARVRVVNMPMSDYNRWSYTLAHRNIAAGEDIRYLMRDVAQGVDLPNHDFWLFDSYKLLRMNFGEDDRFLGGELVDDDTEIVQHNRWRDTAQHYAIARDEFANEEQSERTERSRSSRRSR